MGFSLALTKNLPAKAVSDVALKKTIKSGSLRKLEAKYEKLAASHDSLLSEFHEMRNNFQQAACTPNGVRVGEDAHCVYECAVYQVEVSSFHKRDRLLTVSNDTDEWEARFSDCFPLTPEGRQRARDVAAEQGVGALEKEAHRAHIIIHALEGDLTVKALTAIGSRALTSMASIIGLNPFTDLKGMTGNERTKLIAKAARKFRSAKGSNKLLMAAKAVQKGEDAAKSLRDAARLVRVRRERENGRSLKAGTIPKRPKVGDFIKNEKVWYRITSLPAKKGARGQAVRLSSDEKMSFFDLRFLKLTDLRRTPAWAPIAK